VRSLQSLISSTDGGIRAAGANLLRALSQQIKSHICLRQEFLRLAKSTNRITRTAPYYVYRWCQRQVIHVTGLELVFSRRNRKKIGGCFHRLTIRSPSSRTRSDIRQALVGKATPAQLIPKQIPTKHRQAIRSGPKHQAIGS